jgi:uncharacterized protein
MTTSFESLAEQGKHVDFKHGDLCHIEFPVTDLARAKKFYGELFGWQFHDVPEMGYTLLMTPGGKLGGGFFHPDEHQPARVVNYMNVGSIDETVTKIEALGGKVLGPKVEIPGHGHMQHLLDSEGNAIALWQA